MEDDSGDLQPATNNRKRGLRNLEDGLNSGGEPGAAVEEVRQNTAQDRHITMSAELGDDQREIEERMSDGRYQAFLARVQLTAAELMAFLPPPPPPPPLTQNAETGTMNI